MSSILTQTLFAGLLDSPAVVEATAHVLERAIPVIKEHFTLTAAEISKAYQNSCRYSFVAIQIGLESPDSLIKKVRYPNITREFARQVENDYFQPFSEQHDALRNTLVKSLKKWAKTTDKLFVIKEITEEDLAAFIVQRETAAIGDLILAQMADIEAVDDGLSAFLRFKSLLGDSVLFFFREQLRTDSRVQATQMALQQERLCIEVKNVQATLDDLKETQARHPFLTEQISLQIENLAQWQTQHKQLLGFQNRFAGQLDKVLDWAQDLTVNVAFLQEDVAEIKQDGKRNLSLTEQILANLEALMAQQGLSAQMKVRDEFTQHNEQSLQLIKEAWQQFKGLSAQSPDYYRLANNFGSVLSSTGDVKKAIGLFQQVVERSLQPEEQALAYFNLFQLQLREKQYKVAVNNLQAAIKIDRHRYALHDVHKYPIKRLLGAGGMGCVFLCDSRLEKWRSVVVKCFWENRKGNLDKIFREPLLMAEIAGQYVPKSLDYGFVNNVRQERAFFVTEYIEGAIDGEVWLQQHGNLDLETGLSVALQIAQGLQIAHQAGICHFDLKPANILLISHRPLAPSYNMRGDEDEVSSSVGEEFRERVSIQVKIIDFGLSQVAHSLRETVVAQRTGLTQFGQAIFGTLDYAPPEQRGLTQYGLPDKYSDLFGFGVTMYRLLTGKPAYPFRERHLPKIEDLRELLGDCVEAEPQHRPKSVQVVIEKLEVIRNSLKKDKNQQAKIEKAKQAEIARRKKLEEELKKEKQAKIEKEQQVETARRKKLEEELKKEKQAKIEKAQQSEIARRKKLEKEKKQDKGELFKFEVVIVDKMGKITNKKQHQAYCKSVDLGKEVILEMVYIPGGTFKMGSNENGTEKPIHQVKITPFFMGKYPITQKQYQAIIGKNPANFKGDNRPVEKVSWNEAVAFCKKLSEKMGKEYRLPSEAEWEYACRAGTTTPFYFGETITTDLANYDGNSTYGSGAKGEYRRQTTEVGIFPPNAFGLYDMHGNVWEWCADPWHGNYDGAPADGTVWSDATSNERRVLRGGSWYDFPNFSRSAYRGRNNPDVRNNFNGFRVFLVF